MSERDLTYGIARREERQKVDFRICMIYMRDRLQQSVYGRGSDLSEGGMAIYAAAEVTEGSKITIQFTLPFTRQSLLIEAIVRNKQGYRYGLEFLTLSSSQREQIKRQCQSADLIGPA